MGAKGCACFSASVIMTEMDIMQAIILPKVLRMKA
jgi:hypothetical protein